MLLAGKYFIIGCIKSPVLHWDRSTEDFRWLEWAFGEALGVEDAYFCHLLWKYMVILSTSSSWSSYLSLCRMTLRIFFPCAEGIEQLLPCQPSRWQFPLPRLLCHRRSCILALHIAALTLKSFWSSSCF